MSERPPSLFHAPAPAASEPAAHPFADRVGDGFVVTESFAPIVELSSGRTDLLRHAILAGKRVVLVTPESSRLTEALFRLLLTVDGRWVTRTGTGLLRDAFTGQALASPEEALALSLIETTGPDTVPAFDTVPMLSVNLSVQHTDSKDTVLGGIAVLLAERLGQATPAGWGVCEPAALRWDRTQVTSFVRSRMPGEARLYLSFDGTRRMHGEVRVARSKPGVIEETTLTIALAAEEAPQASAQVPQVLGEVADRFPVMMGTVFLRAGRPDLTIDPFIGGMQVPVAAVIGPRQIRDLGVTITDAVERLGAFTAGRRRIPSLVFPFTRPHSGSGAQWQEFARFLGVDALARVMGVPAWEGSLADTRRPVRPTAKAAGVRRAS